MKAAVYYTNSDVRVEDRPDPRPEKGGLVVKTECCGVCVADTMEWYNKPKAPIVLGHEATGVVTELGEDTVGFKVGDRVFAHHHVPCMTCDECRRGRYTLCRTFKSTRYDPGGFCEYFALSARNVAEDTLLLPENVAFDEGTLIEPLACVIHAVRRMHIRPDDNVVIVGAGTIGLMFVQVLHAYGVSDINVFERIDWRRDKAAEFGAIVWDDANKYISERKGANKVLVIAKDISAMELGLSAAGTGADVLFFATPADDEYLKFYVSKAFFKEMRIVLSYSADHNDTREALRLIGSGLVKVRDYITHRYSLSQLADAIAQTTARGRCLKCIIDMNLEY